MTQIYDQLHADWSSAVTAARAIGRIGALRQVAKDLEDIKTMAQLQKYREQLLVEKKGRARAKAPSKN